MIAKSSPIDFVGAFSHVFKMMKSLTQENFIVEIFSGNQLRTLPKLENNFQIFQIIDTKPNGDQGEENRNFEATTQGGGLKCTKFSTLWPPPKPIIVNMQILSVET